jgi:serine/threonine-protein kinase
MGSKPEVDGAEIEGVDTMSDEGAVAAAPLASEPPVTGWDRYELLDLLGHGGMGAVYKARDRRLGRIVAIKLILGADPGLAIRLAREARAQARIDHPHVCRVHEVGEVDGRPYIALQFIAGEPLRTAAARMTLDQKIAVMRDVAEAIQEAHRLGIVHRDITPANVLIELTEDGRWFPVVVDFGLARETTVDAGLTRSGAVLGTPQYISPEQARGDLRAIDRRSDVYGLGAVLYELLTGRPPFADPALAQLLARVIHDEPAHPRSVVSSLPVDLETIALKCLAKDPAQRYASARALADDLGRYLAGQPILGRRPSLWHRLRLRARRHRAVVALGAGSLAVIAVVSALGVRAWLMSRAERSRTAEITVLAQRLGQEAKDIELFLRTAYQLPLQDTRPARDLIRARMRAIAATRHGLGALGDAVVHDALGRGHLALHEWREATDELTRARDAGLDTPELHAARGRALGELYHRALENARRSGDPAWLAGRRAELDRQYLTPAMAELAVSRGSGDSEAYLEAMIALYRNDFTAAERTALAAADHAPWLFEARKLAADAAHGGALVAFDRGDYDAARPGFERAEALYAQATEVARSDASVYEASAQASLQRAELDFRQGRSPREPLDRALEAIDRALRASPDDGPAYTTKAYVLLRWYRTPALYGAGEAVPLLERIAEAAGRAVELDAQDAGAWDALGNAHTLRGTYESYHGGQGAAWWQRARDEIGHALAIRPGDPWANNDLGIVHRWLGTSLDQTGRDPMPEYEAALRSYERATTSDPQYAIAWSNQVDLQATIAEYHASRGVDPRPDADRARRAGERCLAIDPSFDLVLDNMAQAQLSLANHLTETRGDPAGPLAIARDYLDRAEQRHPGHMITWFHRLAAAGAEARVRLRDGLDPTPALDAGRAALVEVLRLQPGSPDAYVEAARLDLVEAARAASQHGAASAILARARANAAKAIALDSQFADAKLVAAEACLQIAIAQHSREAAQCGLDYVDQALAINPQLARARELRAALTRR